GTETIPQFLYQFVVEEAQIGCLEFGIQHPGISKERQGSALCAVRWNQQNFTFTFKEGAGDVSVDSLHQPKHAVREHEVQVFAVDGDMANMMDICQIEDRLQKLAVKHQRTAWRRRLRAGHSGQAHAKNEHSRNQAKTVMVATIFKLALNSHIHLFDRVVP